MNIIIIEDEKPAARLLQRKVEKLGLQVNQMLHSVEESIHWFNTNPHPDLIFLDIQLSDGLSFEIFETLDIKSAVIFTTAYDEYALRAFKLNSIDYLLKPIALKELQFALDKFKKQQQLGDKDLISSIALAYQQINKEYKTRFLVKLGQTIDTIPTDEIHHFETKESLSFLVTNKGNRYLIDYTLDQLETMLHPQNFFRINRKIILHIQSIQKVSTYFNSRLSIATKYLDNEARIVSRDRVNDFKKWLDN